MVESLYPWESNAKGHLSFPKGAQIRVLERHDDWWMGEYNSQTGWFPKTYVKPAGENRSDFALSALTDIIFLVRYHVFAFSPNLRSSKAREGKCFNVLNELRCEPMFIAVSYTFKTHASHSSNVILILSAR